MITNAALPVVQAPMAGGPSTPELTAAVTRAGGYGFVAGGYLTADALRSTIERTRQLAEGPFGVNLFVPAAPSDPGAVRRYAERLAPEAARLGVALGEPRWDDDDYEAKLDVALDAAVDTVTFTFGCPTAEIVERVHRAGAQAGVTVTSPAEAKAAAAAGADLVVAQGTEAGGHQGGFLDLAPNDRTLHALVAEVLEAVPLPVVATGGLMTGPDVAAVLAAGAVAAQLGTALLCTPEAATSDVHRRALLERRFADTVVTRAYSGRFARGLANRFAVEHSAHAPQGYPEIHHLTRPLRTAATKAGDADVPNLWAGTGWRAARAEPAIRVIEQIAAQLRTSS